MFLADLITRETLHSTAYREDRIRVPRRPTRAVYPGVNF